MSDAVEQTVLAHLFDTCRDAERGFLAAAGEATSPELKRLLVRLAEQRHEFAADLLPHVQRFGLHALPDGTMAAALHRAWIHLRAHATKDPDRAIVNEIARGERVAHAAYRLAHQNLPSNARTLIETHELGILVAGRLVAGTAR